MRTIVPICLLISLTFACELGQYPSGSGCLPCDSSCKECTTSGECTSCEMFMFLNHTSKLCEYCADGEFYDHTTKVCRSCTGTCDGYCGYQAQCFDCPTGEVLDLDSLSCVTACDSSKILISDSSNFNLAQFCRSKNFYVDPMYDGQVEVGTQGHPYRTLLAVFDEILLHFSNSESQINVYIKEGTQNYIQDSKIFLVNMTLITITTYNDSSAPAGFSTIYSTDSSMPKISSKAGFSLIKDTTVSLAPIIAAGAFTSELSKIGTTGATIEATKTSITIDHILARRIAATTSSGIFLYLIYLQEKTMTLTNTEFYVTGSLVTTNDPMNIHIENVYADTYQTSSVFFFATLCNYPEAFLTPTVVITNLTLSTSNLDDSPASRPRFFYYDGPGTITVNNFDITKVFNYVSPNGMILSGNEACNPDDDLDQDITLNYLFSTVPQNSGKTRTNALVIGVATPISIRKVTVNITNVEAYNFESPEFA